MYVWDKVTAKCSSVKVASCLLHYLENNHDPATEKKLVLVSDNCAGQNKNINMVLTCLRLVHGGKFDSVRHVFLVPRHSYMPCDRQFGNNELKLLKHPNIYTKDDYVGLIKTAVQGGFKVVVMSKNDFVDMWQLQSSITT